MFGELEEQFVFSMAVAWGREVRGLLPIDNYVVLSPLTQYHQFRVAKNVLLAKQFVSFHSIIVQKAGGWRSD